MAEPTKQYRNAKKWNVGDLVLHSADAKKAIMLMRVIKIQKNGIYVTKYANPRAIVPNCFYRQYGGWDLIPEHIKRQYTKQYKNDKKFLLDPATFGVDVEEWRSHN